MRRFLPLISLLLTLSSCAGLRQATPAEALGAGDSGRACRYTFVLEGESFGLSGICLVKSDSSQFRGSVINEFGVRLFDFQGSVRTGKTEVSASAGPLRRRAVRKILAQDIGCAVTGISRRASLQSSKDDNVLIVNDTKYKLKLKFGVMPSDNQ